jgi:hypothetical protein
MADAIRILGHLFLGAPAPRCPSAADANDTGLVDMSDAVTILAWLFLGSAEPPAPGPGRCGIDPTPDGLGCGAGCLE